MRAVTIDVMEEDLKQTVTLKGFAPVKTIAAAVEQRVAGRQQRAVGAGGAFDVKSAMGRPASVPYSMRC